MFYYAWTYSTYIVNHPIVYIQIKSIAFVSNSAVFMPYMISQTVIADDAVDAMISQLAALALSNQTAQNLATLAQLFFQLGDLATNGNVTFKEEVKTLLSNGIFS